MCAMIEKLRIRCEGLGIGAGKLARLLEKRYLTGEGVPVLVEDQVDALADVLSDRNAGLLVQLLEPLVLLRRDVDRRGDLLPRHAVTMRDNTSGVKPRRSRL